MSAIEKTDPEIWAAIKREMTRQKMGLELIASENYTSAGRALKRPARILTNKYAEGYPGRRYYGGCEVIDTIEELARRRACASSAATMPTCSRTPARRPTWPST